MAKQNELKLGTTLYSLTNEYHGRQYSFEQLIAKVSELNLGPGLEIVGFQSIRGFPEVTDEFADRFQSLMDQYGLQPSCLGINADVGLRADREMTIEESVAYHEPQILAAAKLGFPVARYQYPAGPEVIRRLVPLAERVNVKLGIEIHAPHAVDSPDVMAYREMYAKVNSPNLGFIPDFGASARAVPPSFVDYFREQGIPEQYIELALQIWQMDGDRETRIVEFGRRARAAGAKDVHVNALNFVFGLFSKQNPRAWLELMPHVIHIHGKFFDFDEAGNEVAVPYDELLPVFRDAGYDGFISSEWEGHMYSDANGFEKLTAHHALCNRILARH